MLDLYSSDREWMKFAACTSSYADAWFPAKGTSTQGAKRICNGTGSRPPCPVRDKCLEYALSHDDRFGVWGGKSERERRYLKRRAT